MGAARTKSKLVRRDLVESTVGGGKVDREKRIIAGVKILGKSSPNNHGMASVDGTEYSDAAMDAAIPLYEGIKSYTDHVRSNPNAERSTRDLVGVHRNVRREADGLHSDFHYRSSHAYLADDAEQMPDALGFSHNAIGSGSVQGRKYLVESIDKVRSMDLVTQPATTRGLYESKEHMKTLRQVIDDLKLGVTVQKNLLEMDGLNDAALATPVADAGAAGGDYKQHLGEAIKAILADDSLDVDAKKAKILALLKATDDTKPEEKSGDENPSPKEADAKMESLEAEVKKLNDREAIRDLCESMNGFKPTKLQLETLTLLESEAKRKELIGVFQGVAAPKTGPRSQSPRPLQESTGDKDKPADAKGWLTRLTKPSMAGSIN